MGKETEPSPSKASEKDGSSKPKKTQSSQHKSPGTKKVGSKKKTDEPSATDTIIKSPVPKKKRKLSCATEKSSSENTNKPVANEHVYGASAVKEKSHKGNSKVGLAGFKLMQFLRCSSNDTSATYVAFTWVES